MPSTQSEGVSGGQSSQPNPEVGDPETTAKKPAEPAPQPAKSDQGDLLIRPMPPVVSEIIPGHPPKDDPRPSRRQPEK
jgi:hypothetical protein